MAQTSPGSGRTAHKTSVIRGRGACTSAATSSQFAKGSESRRGGWAGSLSHSGPHQSTARVWGLAAAVSPSKWVSGAGRGGGGHPSAPPGRAGSAATAARRSRRAKWAPEPAPCVGEAGAAGVRPEGAREEDPGVPPLHGPANTGPLGPKLGPVGALDGRRSNRAVCTLVVGVLPPIQGPGEEVLEAHDPRAQALEGGKGTGGAGPPPGLVGGGQHLSGLAGPPSYQAEAMVPSPVPGEWGGRASVPAPLPSASSSWSL